MLKTFKKEQISCRGGFCEEMKAFGVEKMHQIQTDIDKIQKKNQILKTLSSFCVLLEKLGALEFPRRSTRKQIGCQEGFFGK